jgi:hypothetical protein
VGKRIPDRDRRRKAFLRALAIGSSVAQAAEGSGLAWSTLYAWRRDEPKFRAAWDRAAKLGQDALADRFQSALVERAVDGIDEPVFHAGEIVGHRKRYSDPLLMYGLRELRERNARAPAPFVARTPRVTVVIEPFDEPTEEELQAEGKPAAAEPIAAPETIDVPVAPRATPAPSRPLSRWGDDVDPETDERW